MENEEYWIQLVKLNLSRISRNRFQTITRDTEIKMDLEEVWPNGHGYTEARILFRRSLPRNDLQYYSLKTKFHHHPHLPLWIWNSGPHTCTRTHWRWACGLNQMNKSAAAVRGLWGVTGPALDTTNPQLWPLHCYHPGSNPNIRTGKSMRKIGRDDARTTTYQWDGRIRCSQDITSPCL